MPEHLKIGFSLKGGESTSTSQKFHCRIRTQWAEVDRNPTSTYVRFGPGIGGRTKRNVAPFRTVCRSRVGEAGGGVGPGVPGESRSTRLPASSPAAASRHLRGAANIVSPLKSPTTTTTPISNKDTIPLCPRRGRRGPSIIHPSIPRVPANYETPTFTLSSRACDAAIRISNCSAERWRLPCHFPCLVNEPWRPGGNER